MPNATVRANARSLPEATNRRALLGAVLIAGAAAATALPACAAFETPGLSAVDRRQCRLDSQGCQNLQERLAGGTIKVTAADDCANLSSVVLLDRPNAIVLICRYIRSVTDLELASTVTAGNAIEYWPRSAGQFWPTPRPSTYGHPDGSGGLLWTGKPKWICSSSSGVSMSLVSARSRA